MENTGWPYPETTKRINHWESEVERLTKYCEENPDDVDAYLSLEEAKAELNFAWQDDELEEMGLR